MGGRQRRQQQGWKSTGPEPRLAEARCEVRWPGPNRAPAIERPTNTWKPSSRECLMFFHIDESGNTGMNLSDRNQPRLSYGVLSSRLNVDALGSGAHKEMTGRLGVDALHANEMGVGGLAKIEDVLFALQTKYRFGFDYYYIEKPVHALVVLFDAVFDAGINDAVKWDLYWTPLRFPASRTRGDLRGRRAHHCIERAAIPSHGPPSTATIGGDANRTLESGSEPRRRPRSNRPSPERRARRAGECTSRTSQMESKSGCDRRGCRRPSHV